MSRSIETHYHYDVGGSINAIESLQMLRRARNTNAIKLFLNSRVSTLWTDIEPIQRNMLDYATVDEWGKLDKLDVSGKLLSEITLKSNILRNGSKYSIAELLKYQFKNTPKRIQRNM